MPSPRDTFHWLDVDRIAEELHAANRERDPLSVRFPELRDLVKHLPGFEEQPGHPVNERILETIQMRWLEEREDAGTGDDDDQD